VREDGTDGAGCGARARVWAYTGYDQEVTWKGSGGGMGGASV